MYEVIMAEIIRKAINGYKLVFIEITDTTTQNWFLIAKPYQGLLLLGIYLLFIFKWGPRWMRKRPAFNVDRLLIAYNALQVIICATLFLKAQRFWGLGGKYKWVCEPVDLNSEDGLLMAKLTYYYFLLKVFDLLDTCNLFSCLSCVLIHQPVGKGCLLYTQIARFKVFFVLRKKFNQVSFLHVYHHTGMVMLIWAAVTYYPGGHGTLIGVVNCFVHTVMYSYYLLTVISPSVKNLLWVKKMVTQLQIIQFFIFVVHMSVIIFKPDCQYPRWTAAIFLPQNLFMLILFIDFYIKTYIKSPKHKKVEAGTVKEDADDEIIYTKTNENGKILIKNDNGSFIISELNSGLRVRSLDYNHAER